MTGSPRKPARQAAALLAAGAGLWLAGSPAGGAQRAESLPPVLEDVGVTEHLERPLPLDLAFLDERGQAVRLRDFFGDARPVVLTLNYYECPMLCTLVLNGLAEALAEIDWVPGRQFEIVTVSIDPDETPELARQKKETYLRAYGRPDAAAGWHFLTGKEDSIRQLADATGFRFAQVPGSDQWAHAAVIFVVTPDGRLSRYLYGVKFEPRTVRLSLVEASQGEIGSALDQLILYCYHYDPEAGTYAPEAFKIMQIGGLLTVAVLGGLLAALWVREARRRREA